MKRQSYNFATAISIVIGVVIGSGIFFKADDILLAVNGSVSLALIGFLIVGVGVLFGALTVSYYSQLDTKSEGLIGYSKMTLGRSFAYIVGWFSIACYFPTLMVVLALLTADYLGMLLGVGSQLYITVATAFFLFSNLWINYKFPKASGNIQVLSTVAKIIPLVVVGLVGAIFFRSDAQVVTTTALSGGKPMSALIAIAFSFDGWIVAANIAGDLENSKKNLPRALALGSLAILVIYIIYFFGLTRILTPDQIVSLGDEHILVAAQMLVGPIGAKLILIFVIISVYGGFNGMTLAFVRLPEEMVAMKLLSVPKGFKQNIGSYSVALCMGATIFWFGFQQLIDYGLVFSNLETYFDISSMPILIIYIIYVVLFLAVNVLVAKEGLGKRLYYLVISLIATVTSLMIIVGTMEVNGLIYIVFSVIIVLIGLPLYNRNY